MRVSETVDKTNSKTRRNSNCIKENSEKFMYLLLKSIR